MPMPYDYFHVLLVLTLQIFVLSLFLQAKSIPSTPPSEEENSQLLKIKESPLRITIRVLIYDTTGMADKLSQYFILWMDP